MTADRDAVAEVLRREIAAFVCNVSNLPTPLQTSALGLDMSPLIDGLAAALLASDALAGVIAAKQAEALREAADSFAEEFGTRGTAAWLRNRAAAKEAGR